MKDRVRPLKQTSMLAVLARTSPEVETPSVFIGLIRTNVRLQQLFRVEVLQSSQRHPVSKHRLLDCAIVE